MSSEGREMGALMAAMLVVLAVAVASGASKEQLSTRECEDLGFTGLALCSDCNSLAEYVKDQGYPSNPISFLFLLLFFYFLFFLQY